MAGTQTDLKTTKRSSYALLASFGVHDAAVFKDYLPGFHISVAPEGLIYLKGAVQAATPDLLILDCKELNESVLAVLADVRKVLAAPILVFADTAQPDMGQKALRAGADSCVIDGFIPHRLPVLAAIAAEHYNINAEIRGELSKVKASLESRKIIDRAKGLLMDQKGMKEAEAYELMRQNAMSHNQTMKQVAENILTMSGLFG